jgi:hypothetical protein
VSEPKISPTPEGTSFSKKPGGAQQQTSALPDPEALPGGYDLLEYKDILKSAITAFSLMREGDIDSIKQGQIITTKKELDRIKKGMTKKRYKSTRAQFAIDEEVVSKNVEAADERLTRIKTLIHVYNTKKLSIEEIADCSSKISEYLKDYALYIDKAQTQFVRVKTLKRKKQ